MYYWNELNTEATEGCCTVDAMETKVQSVIVVKAKTYIK